MELVVRRESVDTFEVVRVAGEIDVYSAPALRRELIDAVDAGHVRLVVDLDEVGFLDSTGIGVLVGALKRVRAQGGSLEIVCSQERLLKVFEITGLDKVFVMHSSLEPLVS